MSLAITPRRLDDVVIVDLTGRITIGEGAVALRQAIERWLDEGERRFLLNLAGVDYIDSSGLGALVSLLTTVRGRDGEMKLLALTRRVRGLLQITKLLTVFDFFDDEPDALRSFR